MSRSTAPMVRNDTSASPAEDTGARFRGSGSETPMPV